MSRPLTAAFYKWLLPRLMAQLDVWIVSKTSKERDLKLFQAVDVVEGWAPSWTVDEFLLPAFLRFVLSVGRGWGPVGLLSSGPWEGLSLGCWETPAPLGRSIPRGQCWGGSPTRAPKFKGSPLTRDFKWCFKAEQHPWARGVGFHLGPICRTHRRSCCKLRYRGSWIKGSKQTVCDTVFTACVIWKYHSTQPIYLPLHWGTFIQESQV